MWCVGRVGHEKMPGWRVDMVLLLMGVVKLGQLGMRLRVVCSPKTVEISLIRLHGGNELALPLVHLRPP